MKIKKFFGVIMAVFMLAIYLSATGITATARGIFDDAITMRALELHNVRMENLGDNKYFKITLPSDGKVTIRTGNANAGMRGLIGLKLLNSNAEQIGKSRGIHGNDTVEFGDLKRGTYYINIHPTLFNNFGELGVNDIYYTFTPDDPNFQQSQPPATNILRMTVTINIDDTLELGTTIGEDRARWQSSNRDVATVSKTGIVTARARGTAIIAANVDGRVVRIVVRVR